MVENAERNVLKEVIVRSSKYISNKALSCLSNCIDEFYWSFIASCCKCIQVDVKNIKKFNLYSFAIEKLSSVYFAYWKNRTDIAQPLCEFPEEKEHSDVKKYFQWIIKIQNIFSDWQKLFEEQAYNYDDIIAYAIALPTIARLAPLLDVDDFVYVVEEIEEFKRTYYELYFNICTLILKKSIVAERYGSQYVVFFCFFLSLFVCLYHMDCDFPLLYATSF